MRVTEEELPFGLLSEVIIELNGSRVNDGFIQLTRLDGHDVLEISVTDSYLQASADLTLGREEVRALIESLARMLSEAE